MKLNTNGMETGNVEALPPKDKSRISAFMALKNRNFLLLWLGMFASYNAMQMQVVANGWLVYSKTGSPLALGLVSAGWGAPILLFSLYGGALADRVLKRNILISTQIALSLATSTIAFLVTSNRIMVWHLVISSMLMGTILAFSLPARQAFIVDLVGKDEQLNAIALSSVAANFCRIASPAFAGVLLKIIGIPGVYWIIAGSNMVVIFMLFRITPGASRMSARPNVPMIQDVLEGLRYIRGNSIVMGLLVLAFVPIILAMPYQMLMPVFAKSVFHAGETGLGILMSAIGAGALLGSGLIAALGQFKNKGTLMLTTGLIFGAFLVFFGMTKSIAPACFLLVFAGAGSSMMMTLINSLIMANTPHELVGRVMSLFVMTFGLMPFGMLPAGALAEAFGAPFTVKLGGALLAFFIIVISIALPNLKKLS